MSEVDERGESSMREAPTERGALDRSVGGAFGASLALHLLAVFILAALPRVAPPRPVGTEIELELVAPAAMQIPPHEELPQPVDEPSDDVRPEAPSESSPTPSRVDAHPAVGATVSGDPNVEASPGGEGGEPVEGPSIQAPEVHGDARTGLPIDPSERSRLEALVAPGNAASSWVVQQAEGPSRPSGPAGLGASGGRPQVASAEEASSALSGHLRSRAMERPWLSRTEPRLVPRPDGTLEYRGHAFTARIAPDGAVRFSDRDAIQVDEMLQGGPGRFDVTDMIMRGSGQDPYAAEREWFMEHTEEVRARLESEARARERDAALRGVPGRLATLWGRERPAFLRRRAIFRMWDDCEETGDGLSVRRQIIEFIRGTIPRSSPDAFTDQEITEMNARRDSTMEFVPY